MCRVSLGERQSRTELRRRIDVEAIGDVIRRCRLRGHGHVEWDPEWGKSSSKLVVEATVPDMHLLRAEPRIVQAE